MGQERATPLGGLRGSAPGSACEPGDRDPIPCRAYDEDGQECWRLLGLGLRECC
jgi:hypothetical protein